MIRKETAQRICSEWHNGQCSAFYQYSSSGVFVIGNTLQYLKEVEECLHPEYALYPGTLNKKDARELNNLKDFFEVEANKNGIEIVWEKHSIYRYNIPFISKETPENITNRVKNLHYAI